MRRHLVGLVSAALVITSSATAAATPRGPSAPGAPAGPVVSPTLTRRADVDGDGRRDTVSLTRRRVTPEEYTFRLTVRTATGRRAIRDAIVTDYVEGTLTTDDVWGGTADVDGARGAEIRIERGGNVGDQPWPHLFTWRGGRLVPAVAPGATAADPAWDVSDHFLRVAGYRFSTRNRLRYVTATRLAGHTTDGERFTYQGTSTTYRWERGTWRPIRAVRTATLDEGRALTTAGWNGVTWTL